MKARTLIWAIALLTASVSNAEATPTDNASPSLLGGPLKVSQIVVGHSGHSQVELKNAAGTIVSCGSSNSFFSSRSHPSHDLMHKSLMAAYLTSKSVTFIGYENLSGTCWVKGLGNG